MCFATAALIAGGVGAAVSAGGAIETGQANANAANYRAQVASNNAIIAKQNADYAIKAGEVSAETQGLKGAATGGTLLAHQGASGVDVGSGSAVDVRTSQREGAKLDSETVMNNAELQAYGYGVQSTNYTAESQLDTLTANQATTGADIGAAGSLLSNASSLGFKWSGMGSGGSPAAAASGPSGFGGG